MGHGLRNPAAHPFERGQLMLTLRRNTDRCHIQRGEHHVWLTFLPNQRQGPPVEDFGILANLDEVRFPPGGSNSFRPGNEAEVLTYVYSGALAQEDSAGNSGVVHAGEFQHMIVGPPTRHKETNTSRTDCAHIFRVYLHPSEVGLDFAHEQKRMETALRRNTMCVVASPDGRKGSLRVFQDAVIYSSVLDPGHHLIHGLSPGRSAWLHVIHGEAMLQDLILSQGDGVGVTTELSVSFTARENTEIILVDLGPTPRLLEKRVVP